MSGMLEISIVVTDINDNSPQFEQSAYHVIVEEDVEMGQSLLNVSAFDADEGVNGKVVYGFAKQTLSSVAGSIFQINSATGEIVIRKGLDYEKDSNYLLLVTAKDMGPGVDNCLFQGHGECP